MKLTKKKAIKLHRELWDWLYHHPSKSKDDWPRWEVNGGSVREVQSDCFACEYMKIAFAFIDCCNCPLDWSPTEFCMSGGGYFQRWEVADAWQTRKKYAKLIRDLPEK